MKRVITALACGACIAVATAAVAADDPIANRQAIMKNVGAATGVLGKMAKGEMEFDALAAQMALRVINTSSYGYGELFPAGSETGGNTEAKDTIWSDMDGFQAAIVKFQVDTAAAVAAPPAAQADLGPILGSIGANCGACHKAYRIAKN